MTTMTHNEWRSFVTTGTRLGHVAVTRTAGRPHATPVCFIIDGDDLTFALSPGSVKGSQDELVGVKCRWNRGWAASQFRIVSV